MNRTRAPAFRSAEEIIAPGRRVAVTGPISRTWYRDEAVLNEVFEYLHVLGADFAVIADVPFRLCVERTFKFCGVDCDVYGTRSPEADVFFSCVDLVVALGPRTSTQLEVPLAAEAFTRGIPILVLWPDGRADFLDAAP